MLVVQDVGRIPPDPLLQTPGATRVAERRHIVHLPLIDDVWARLDLASRELLVLGRELPRPHRRRQSGQGNDNGKNKDIYGRIVGRGEALLGKLGGLNRVSPR